MVLCWGIIGAGDTSGKFVEVLHAMPNGNHRVVAVLAKTSESAEKFAKKYYIPKVYEEAKSMAGDKRVEIVYVGAIKSNHYKIVRAMLLFGKHVLCRSPLSVNRRLTKNLISMAKLNRVFLMEDVWSRCFPLYTTLQNHLNSGTIGNVTQVIINYGANIGDTQQLISKDQKNGVVTIFGFYALQFQQFVYRNLKPIQINAQGHADEHRVDVSANIILNYPGQKTAIINLSFLAEMPAEAIISGSKGTIRIPNFSSPEKFFINDKVEEFRIVRTIPQHNFGMFVGQSYEAEVVRKCIEAGQIESSNMTHDETLMLSEILDEIRKQLSIVYREDYHFSVYNLQMKLP